MTIIFCGFNSILWISYFLHLYIFNYIIFMNAEKTLIHRCSSLHTTQTRVHFHVDLFGKVIEHVIKKDRIISLWINRFPLWNRNLIDTDLIIWIVWMRCKSSIGTQLEHIIPRSQELGVFFKKKCTHRFQYKQTLTNCCLYAVLTDEASRLNWGVLIPNICCANCFVKPVTRRHHSRSNIFVVFFLSSFSVSVEPT